MYVILITSDDAQTHPEGGARSGYRRLSSPSGIIKVTKLQIYHGASFTESQLVLSLDYLAGFNDLCSLYSARFNSMSWFYQVYVLNIFRLNLQPISGHIEFLSLFAYT